MAIQTPEQWLASQTTGDTLQPTSTKKSKIQTPEEWLATQPVSKPTLGSKVGGFVKELGKAIVSPVVTTVARPFQAVAQLAGAKSEDVDRFSSRISKGLIAPVPQSGSDVVKDIGRAAQTVALGASFTKPVSALLKAGTLGQKAGYLAGEGAAFGAGAALEQGGAETTAKDFLKQTAIGAGIGGAIPFAGKGLGKVFGKGATKVEEVMSKGVSKETPIVTKASMEAEKAGTKIEPAFQRALDETTVKIPKIPKAEAKPVKLTQKEYKQYDDFFEQDIDDKLYKNSTIEKWVAKTKDLVSKNKVKDILDTIFTDKAKVAFPEGLPKEVVRKYLQLNDNLLTTGEKRRIANKITTSEAGAELRATQIFMSDKYEKVGLIEKKLQKELAKKGVTKQHIINFLDDNICLT